MISRTLAIVCILALMSGCAPAALEEVQSGEAQLHCHLQQGWAKIDKERVVDIIDGTWIFNNGYSSTCKLTRKE